MKWKMIISFPIRRDFSTPRQSQINWRFRAGISGFRASVSLFERIFGSAYFTWLSLVKFSSCPYPLSMNGWKSCGILFSILVAKSIIVYFKTEPFCLERPVQGLTVNKLGTLFPLQSLRHGNNGTRINSGTIGRLLVYIISHITCRTG